GRQRALSRGACARSARRLRLGAAAVRGGPDPLSGRRRGPAGHARAGAVPALAGPQGRSAEGPFPALPGAPRRARGGGGEATFARTVVTGGRAHADEDDRAVAQGSSGGRAGGFALGGRAAGAA